MQRNRLLIILAVILLVATIAAVAFVVLGNGGGVPSLGTETATPPPPPDEPSTGVPTTQLIVALQPIGRGSQFVQGSIGRRDWPITNMPEDVIADEAETIGKVAKTDIVQGQIIVRSMLTDISQGGDASFLIPPGKVAVAYRITRQTSVNYAIQEDDFVDILVTAHFVDVDEEFQSTLPNKIQFFFPQFDSETGEQSSFSLPPLIDEGRFEIAEGDLPAIIVPAERQIPRRVAQLTVQSAKVIKVREPWIKPPPPPKQDDDDGDGPKPTPTPNLPDTATLAVTPQDALVLLWLRQSGIYSELALRAAGEENADHLTEAVTLQYMLTRFNIAVPPKIEFIMGTSITDLQDQDVLIGNVEEQQSPRE